MANTNRYGQGPDVASSSRVNKAKMGRDTQADSGSPITREQLNFTVEYDSTIYGTGHKTNDCSE